MVETTWMEIFPIPCLDDIPMASNKNLIVIELI